MPSQATTMAGQTPEATALILRVAAGFRVQALAVLKDLELELTKQVQAMGDVATPLQAKYTQMLKETSAAIKGAYALIGEEQGGNLEKLAGLQGKAAIDQLNKSLGVQVFTGKSISPALLQAVAQGPVVMGHPAKDWWAGQSTALQTKFTQQMALGVMAGETNEQLVKRLRGSKADGYKGGIMEVSRRDAETLVRTSAMSVSNAAKIETFKQMDDVVKGIQWVATLDSRTSPICMALDGKQWRLPDMQPVGHDKSFPGPTAHYNCRSTQIAVTYSWAELANKKLKSASNQTIQAAVDKTLEEGGMDSAKIAAAKVRARASMDGQVSDKLTYGDWADEKGADYVESVLGPGRATLFSKGLITFSDLTDQRNRPLTLEQLAATVETGKPPPETLGVEFLPSGKALEAKAVADAIAKAAAEKLAAERAAYKAMLAYQAEIAAEKAAAAAAKKAAEEAAAKAAADKKAALEKLAAEKEAEMAAKIAAQKAILEAEQKAKAEAAAKLAAEALAKQKAEAEALAVEKAKKLAAMQKKWVGDKSFTKAEKDYFTSLPVQEQGDLKAAWDEAYKDKQAAAQLKAAKKSEAEAKKATKAVVATAKAPATAAAQKAVVAAENAVAEPPPDIPRPGDLTFVRKLGGSTGAELKKDATGKLWVVKKGNSPDHVREEWAADQSYKALGVPVPDGHLWEEEGGPVKITRFIEGKTYGDLSKAEQAKAAAQLRTHFAADALMGNWDVLGMSLDNVLVSADGTAYRIDNGGSFRFRAQGGQKTGAEWNGTPRDWFTMRDPATGGGKVFAGVDVVEASRRIEAWDLDKLQAIPMETGLKETVMERARELQVMARRNLDMAHDGIRVDYLDRMTGKTWDLKDAGLRDMIPKTAELTGVVGANGKITSMAPPTIVSDGVKWKGLRAQGAAAKGAATPADIAEAMPGMNEVKLAAISTNFSHVHKKELSDSGKQKVAAAKAAKPLLEATAKLPQDTPLNVAKAAAAKHALEILAEIESQALSGIPAKGVPFFEPKKAVEKAVGAQAANATGKATQARAVSVTDLAYQTHAAKYGNTKAMEQVSSWMASQASDSWNPEAQMAKHFMASLRPGAQYFIKPPNTAASIAKQWAAGASRAGSEAALQDAFETWHAMTYELLRLYPVPFVDTDLRAVRLYRTNSAAVIGSTKKGDILTPIQGSAESHSVFRGTQIFEPHLVEQAVPWHRVLGTYWAERRPGSGHGSFLGDGENELVADGGGIPGRYLGFLKDAVWHKDTNKATGWNVPLTHFRNQDP